MRRSRRNPQDPDEVLARLRDGSMSVQQVHYSTLVELRGRLRRGDPVLLPILREMRRRVPSEVSELWFPDERRKAYLREKERKRGLSSREWSELLLIEEAEDSFSSRWKRQHEYGPYEAQWRQERRLDRDLQESLYIRDVSAALALSRPPYDVFVALNQPDAILDYVRHEIAEILGVPPDVAWSTLGLLPDKDESPAITRLISSVNLALAATHGPGGPTMVEVGRVVADWDALMRSWLAGDE